MSTGTAPIRVHEMEMLVASEPMRQVMAMVERVATTPGAVLITGETGVGKELVARAIHSFSLRCSKPWVDVNCAAIPEHLVESELFGYEKGAFSGADNPKAGLFELADKGTLFLDEIGELDPKVQVKLLRVLDGVPYYRLGGNRKVSVDVRIVTATNRPLEEAVRIGRFRRDLYHRLSQFQIRVPALRDRAQDIQVLGEMFLRQSGGTSFSEEAMAAMLAYSWPGNVRELRNVVMKLAMTTRDGHVEVSSLAQEILEQQKCSVVPVRAAVPAASGAAKLEDLEKQTILRTLQQAGDHQGEAAKLLGISRRTLSRKLKQYRIEASQPAPAEPERRSEVAPPEQNFRIELQVPAHVHDSSGGIHEFATTNVSIGGMGLEGVKNPFSLGRSFRIVFQLPNGQQVESGAHIVWADVKGLVGLRFIDLPQQSFERLRRWIDSQQSQDSWEPAPARG